MSALPLVRWGGVGVASVVVPTNGEGVLVGY